MSQTTVLEPDSFPAEQFEAPEQQREAVTLGMWAFLATEVLFFGVLFLSFFVYRTRWPQAFKHGANELKWYLGAINTVVLLLSSFSMAMAVHSISMDNTRGLIRWMLVTSALGLVFLGIKAIEYSQDYRESLIPAVRFSYFAPGGEARPQELHLFMSFYFVMTLLHATHMVIGLGVIAVLIYFARKGTFNREYHNPIELMGLYWHFVDIVWVFLFPTLYLLRH